jgi:unsaturated chondroitin disaccharide hydrolase
LHQSLILPPDGITTREQFLQAVQDEAERMKSPVSVQILSQTAGPESAPADTLVPHQTKTVSEAIALLQQATDRTAAEWEPVVRSDAGKKISRNDGLGFFTEGDNSTGVWRQQRGYFWTGGFWVGELWQLYGYTHEEKYRKWAQLWGSRLLGQEMQQDHDAGFLYYYSSALGFDKTRERTWRESALRGAGRLEQLYNPRTNLIAAWEVGGDDSIIDTMMNLQILWWASDETREAKWREIATKHALRTAEWFIRPDASVIQSIHYNPGDNRQEFRLHGGSKDLILNFPNRVAPGEWIFAHTHQGFGADTTWSRGAAWALYGFTVAYGETHKEKFLSTAEHIADYILANLPEDDVPWYDFCDEGVHFRNRDSSAGAIIAGGLLRLSALEKDPQRASTYRQAGERIVHSLMDRYLAPVGDADQTPPGVLRHGSSTRPDDSMLIYGQYYLLEDLLWLEQHKK